MKTCELNRDYGTLYSRLELDALFILVVSLVVY